jgi:hypothetical protein
VSPVYPLLSFSTPRYALRRRPFLLLPLLFPLGRLSLCGGCSGSLIARACCRCSGARTLCSDYRMISIKVKGSFAKICYSPDSSHSCARTDGRDHQATWPRSLASILATDRM